MVMYIHMCILSWGLIHLAISYYILHIYIYIHHIILAGTLKKVCVCVCIYIHTYILTYLHTYILTYLHTYLHTYILTYLHTYILTYIHT